MGADPGESYPLPDHPVLAAAAAAIRDSRTWGTVVDHRWRLVWAGDELRTTFGGGTLADFAVGENHFGPAGWAAAQRWIFGSNTEKLFREIFVGHGPFALHDMPGGRNELREAVDPMLADLVDEIEPDDRPSGSFLIRGTGISGTVQVAATQTRLYDDTGQLAGAMLLYKPALGMHTISMLTAMGDAGHLERMERLSKMARRPAAILFADLERSSRLSRRLSTAAYFTLGRRLVTAADRCVIDAGGLVGRHVGDGVAAFFVGETFESESAAARACIAAAQALREEVLDVATRSDLEPNDVVVRFGLHWGSMPYIGAITTAGRSEITALGDEVNEAARVEACATGGHTLASKALVERLSPADGAALGIDPEAITYTMLGELDTATEKARRDAPAIAVCEV